MTANELEDKLKSFLLDPLRCYSTPTPRISNYDDEAVMLRSKEGINISVTNQEPVVTPLLGNENIIFNHFTVMIDFYFRDKQKTKTIIENQKHINLFFNKTNLQEFTVTQLVRLTNKNNNWEISNENNDIVHYNMYESSNDPQLEVDASYLGYRVKNENGDHFLYRIRDSWRILDLQTHLVFPVNRFRGGFAEVVHGENTFLYELYQIELFFGPQFVSLENVNLDYEKENTEYGDLTIANTTILVRDQSPQTTCPIEPEVFEIPVNPSHNYNPSIYNSKFLIAAISGDSVFSSSDWRSGNKVTNSLNIHFPANTNNAFRGIAYSADRISGLQPVSSPFGNIFNEAYQNNGIIDVDGVKYYSYKTNHPYFPVGSPSEYVVTEDPDRDSLIVDYYAGDTGNQPTIDDFSFSNGEIDLDPNRSYYELAIGTEQRSYIAFAFSGQITRIMESTNNLRFDFSPSVNDPFVQKVINGKIFNVIISQKTFFEYSSWRIFYQT